jgi:hypothetical protein
MQLEETNLHCQFPGLRSISEGEAVSPPASLLRQVKLFVRRHMTPSQERVFKSKTNALLNWIAAKRGKSVRPTLVVEYTSKEHIQTGDRVRVRAQEQIEATLNNWHQLKGCTFMPEMAAYCGTEQRVLKAMRRFVDERDLRVKKSSGIVLLEGVMCQGTADFGSCDRSCFYFWREEWLEKLEVNTSTVLPQVMNSK